MKNANLKWIWGIALFVAFALLPAIKKYHSLFHLDKTYVLELASGKVWSLDSYVQPWMDEEPLTFLLPWAKSPPSSHDKSSVVFAGTLQTAKRGTACTALWKKQIACIEYPESQDETLSMLDYYASRRTARQVPSGHPVVDEVNRNLSKFVLSDDEPTPVFTARIALVYQPSNAVERWRTVELGDCVVFQDRGAVFFERATGIELPPVGRPD